MSFKVLQFALNATNGTLSNSTDNPEETTSSDKYLWFLFLDLIIFIGLTYTTYSSSKKLNSEQENPEDFRPKFIKWLVLANGVRALSLIFIIAFGNPFQLNGGPTHPGGNGAKLHLSIRFRSRHIL